MTLEKQIHPDPTVVLRDARDAITPDLPTEDPAVTRLRDRQLAQIADQDEEENRRIKDLLVRGRGQRAFRNSRKGRAAQTGRPGTDGRGSPSISRAFRGLRTSAPGSR